MILRRDLRRILRRKIRRLFVSFFLFLHCDMGLNSLPLFITCHFTKQGTSGYSFGKEKKMNDFLS